MAKGATSPPTPRRRWSEVCAELIRKAAVLKLDESYMSHARLQALDNAARVFAPGDRPIGDFIGDLPIIPTRWFMTNLVYCSASLFGALCLMTKDIKRSFKFVVSINLLSYLLYVGLAWPFWLEAMDRKIERDDESAKISPHQLLDDLLTETLEHRRLEILCRYGDYLAERLGTLSHHISTNGLEIDHKLSAYWTETSATVREERNLPAKPCTDLIRQAAQGLGWSEDVTLFMIDQYGKRNTLMHAELFSLVEKREWDAIGVRCEADVKKLDELFIALEPNEDKISDSDGTTDDGPAPEPTGADLAAVMNWKQVIRDFRDRWVRRSADDLTWEPRLIVQEALAAGIDGGASLSRLARLPDMLSAEERRRAVQTMKHENDQKEAEKGKSMAQGILQAENRRLHLEVELLKDTIRNNHSSAGTAGKAINDAEVIAKLQREVTRLGNRNEQLELAGQVSMRFERALKKKLLDLEVSKEDIEEMRRQAKEGVDERMKSKAAESKSRRAATEAALVVSLPLPPRS